MKKSIRQSSRSAKAVRSAALLIALIAISVTSCTSSPKSSSKSKSTTTVAPATTIKPTHLELTLEDNDRTIDLNVPATITVTLPYDADSVNVWQAASSGVGFEVVGSPAYESTGGPDGKGIEVLKFKITRTESFPLVILYAPPGPLPEVIPQKFAVTLEPRNSTSKTTTPKAK